MVVEVVQYDRVIAKIDSTHLGFEDHGILTAVVTVNTGKYFQSVGNFSLVPENGAACAKFIQGMLGACGVTSWEKLKGRTIYLLKDEKDRVAGIEPLPTEEGIPFLFSSIFE